MTKGNVTLKVAQKEIMTITDSHLASLYKRMIDNGDIVNAEKIIDLYEKKLQNQFNVSFAGHFSAGKSSMINYLLGKDVLPKSPIPTSANIVKIMSGEGVARIFFNEETPVQYKEPYDIDMIKDYATDKDTIKRIEISTSESILPESCAILDTPGIDAADDADRLMTESALHVVDVLYYVMDYNHVQSEVNLYFLQKIQAEQIPFYIIINQIDKHNEQELSFEQFDSNVKQTFEQWNISPETIYYSSVLDESAPHNEIQAIKTDLFALLQNEKDFTKRFFAATREIVLDHKDFLEESFEDKIANISEEDVSTVDLERLEEINKQLTALDQSYEQLKNEFDHELNHTLKNAYLMPAKLRDQAKEFLESQQKDFKIGFFNAKKKTEEERNNRLQSFLTELQKTIEVTIQWKLRDKFNEILRENNIHDEGLLQKVQQLTLDYHAEQLFSFMKPGAQVNGNYVLNYTNEISNNIKNIFRQNANRLWDEIDALSKEKIDAEKSKLQREKEQFESAHEILEAKTKLEEQLQEKLTLLNDDFEQPSSDQMTITLMNECIQERNIVIEQEAPVKQIIEEASIEVANKPEEIEIPHEVANHSVDGIVQMIEKVTSELMHVDGFSSVIQDLQDKKYRLENRQLTIALFGAFSAGKSSFSNALFGEQILPVSPNPTTAVISRISPVTESHTHGTVIITLKDDETLTSDLQTITKDFSPAENDVHGMIQWIREKNIHENDELNKTYQSYLLAVLNGYEERKDQLGKTIEISLEEFPAFVTDESKACYIEAVDLYYDCALTQKGITLVDTPGADSVNARHTNVAFDYIKDADAIIYVTYYNHAITSADRDFLMQLGRVKEAFELDKMFFIVNASDLAEDEAELKLVLNYVEEELLQFGIRHPKIYPVSSKRSLEEKVSNLPLNDEMQTFEDKFYSFIEKDLAALTVQAAIWDMNRAKTTLHNFIESANLSEAEREKHLQTLTEKRSNFKQIVAKTNSDVSKQRILERIERQLHFVLERMYIRFHDMFTEHFNPTTITASGREAFAQLEHNRNQFIDYVGYELLQEVRAVSLRVEANMNELIKTTFNEIQQEIHKLDETFILPSLQETSFDTPEYKQAFLNIDMTIFANALKIFKNNRSFFEQNDREKMKEAFYEQLQPEAKQYLEEQKVIMDEKYVEQWNNEFSLLKERIEKEIDSMIDQHIKVLTDTVNIAELKEKHHAINEWLNKVN